MAKLGKATTLIAIAVGLIVGVAGVALVIAGSGSDVNTQLLDLVHERITADPNGLGGVPDALQWLDEVQASDRGKTADLRTRSEALRSSVKSDLIESTRVAIEEGRLEAAQRWLTWLRQGWPNDLDALAPLEDQARQLAGERSRTARLATLLVAADADISAKNLTTPRGNNAWDKLAEAAGLVAQDDNATRNWIESKRKSIAEAYVTLARAAIAANDLDKAERHVGILASKTPSHPSLPRLEEEIETARTPPDPVEPTSVLAAALPAEDKGQLVDDGQSADDSGPNVFDDEEERLWNEIKDDCRRLGEYGKYGTKARNRVEWKALMARCQEGSRLDE